MMGFLKRARLVAILVAAKGSGGDLVSVILLLLMYIAQLPCYLSIFRATDLEPSIVIKFDIQFHLIVQRIK